MEYFIVTEKEITFSCSYGKIIEAKNITTGEHIGYHRARQIIKNGDIQDYSYNDGYKGYVYHIFCDKKQDRTRKTPKKLW